ncbi:MAG: sulfotransferase family protein [Acidimicrobiales bacterium]
MLPTFLGIGTPKAASTWLHDLLASHPDVLMAEGAKAVAFFNRHFDRGVEWYAGFFPEQSIPPLAVGDYSPHYLYEPACPARVKATVPADRFILSLRNPVDRLESHYRFRQRQDAYRGSFDDFLREYPFAVDWGRYAFHLRPWLDTFDRSQFCILLQEDVVASVDTTKETLAAFLGLDAARFLPGAGAGVANRSFLPQHRRLYRIAVGQARFLRRHGLVRVATAGKQRGVDRRIAGRRRDAGPRFDRAMRQRLWSLYADDVDALEVILGASLDRWRSTSNGR